MLVGGFGLFIDWGGQQLCWSYCFFSHNLVVFLENGEVFDTGNDPIQDATILSPKKILIIAGRLPSLKLTANAPENRGPPGISEIPDLESTIFRWYVSFRKGSTTTPVDTI